MTDNDSPMRNGSGPSPGAHGQAALLLVESLIHGLRENAVLSADQAVDIAERAVDVQLDYAEAAEDLGMPMWESHELLLSIAASLRTDNNGGRPPLNLV